MTHCSKAVRIRPAAIVPMWTSVWVTLVLAVELSRKLVAEHCWPISIAGSLWLR